MSRSKVNVALQPLPHANLTLSYVQNKFIYPFISNVLFLQIIYGIMPGNRIKLFHRPDAPHIW